MATERITNGGFETGTQSGWVFTAGIDVYSSIWSVTPHTGSYFTASRTISSESIIQHGVDLRGASTLTMWVGNANTPGSPYWISIYIDDVFVSNVDVPVYNAAVPWWSRSVNISAYNSSSSSKIEFRFPLNADSYQHIDDISIIATIPTYTVSGIISDEWGNPIRDVDITISNGTTYTTSTDENGAYSQIVDMDTYNITISKPRSTFYDTSESKSITSNTTLNVTMLTNKIPGRHNTSGMSIIGGISLGTK